MTRLIDADALIDVMEERKKIWLSKCEYNDAIREVKEAPTVERPLGEWKQKSVHSEYFYCSKCGYAYRHAFNFCPNCGSDNRPRENNSSSMIINGKYSENVEYGTRIEIDD